jgi:hypothetical protein
MQHHELHISQIQSKTEGVTSTLSVIHCLLYIMLQWVHGQHSRHTGSAYTPSQNNNKTNSKTALILGNSYRTAWTSMAETKQKQRQNRQ